MTRKAHSRSQGWLRDLTALLEENPRALVGEIGEIHREVAAGMGLGGGGGGGVWVGVRLSFLHGQHGPVIRADYRLLLLLLLPLPLLRCCGGCYRYCCCWDAECLS